MYLIAHHVQGIYTRSYGIENAKLPIVTVQ